MINQIINTDVFSTLECLTHKLNNICIPKDITGTIRFIKIFGHDAFDAVCVICHRYDFDINEVCDKIKITKASWERGVCYFYSDRVFMTMELYSHTFFDFRNIQC